MPDSKADAAKRSDLFAAGRIAGGYLLFAALWILLSDRAVAVIVSPSRIDDITRFQTLKGLLFVFVTAAMLMLMVVRRLAHTRKAEREAADTLRRLLALVDHFPGVVYIRDAQNRFMLLRGDVPGSVKSAAGGAEETPHAPETYARQVKRDAEVIATGQPSQLVESITIEGETTHYLVHRFPLTSPTGERWVGGLAVNITERHQAEDRIREMARELEQASRMKDQFLTNLSHELRTPITAIRLWTEVLRNPSPDDMATIREAATMIQHSALTQTLLIEDLLDITRIVGGRLKVEFRPMRLDEVVRKTVELLLPMGEEHQVSIDLDILAAPCRMLGDARRVQQVVWNLLNNAIKFSAQRGKVICRLVRDGDDWLLRVIDHGRGIARQQLPHVFERFRQNEEPHRRSEAGIGIGLSIVRHLVEAHGGTVCAESEGHGLGAVFTARFPAVVEAALGPDVGGLSSADAQDFGTQPFGVPTNGDRILTGRRILFVEDDTDSRSGMALLLGRAGAAVTAVESAEAALAQSGDFDLLLSDIGLPDRDGCELIRALRQRDDWKNRPAVACSAYALPEDRTRAIEAGFDDFVTKPVEPDEMIRMIAEQLANWPRASAVKGHSYPTDGETG